MIINYTIIGLLTGITMFNLVKELYCLIKAQKSKVGLVECSDKHNREHIGLVAGLIILLLFVFHIVINCGTDDNILFVFAFVTNLFINYFALEHLKSERIDYNLLKGTE